MGVKFCVCGNELIVKSSITLKSTDVFNYFVQTTRRYYITEKKDFEIENFPNNLETKLTYKKVYFLPWKYVNITD